MVRYIIKRALYGLLTLFIVAAATFFMTRMVPGGPFLSEKAASPATQKALEKKYGLDKPLMEQFTTYFKDALSGDFGPSIKQRGRNVTDIIADRLPISAALGGLAVLAALVIGVPLGCVAAVNRGKAIDRVISVFCAGGVAIPSFVTCTLLMYVFGVRLGWLPTKGLEGASSYILPVFALALLPTAYVARLMRSSMLDVMGQDYMRTARSKGVSGFTMVFKHAMRNAILPVVSYIGPLLGYLVTGNMVVEKILTIPGLGGSFVSAILARDYPLIMGTTILLAAAIIALSVIVDIVSALIDPRIKLR